MRRRRRECSNCEYRFSTTELYGTHKGNGGTLFDPEIKKRDDKVVSYSFDKLRKSIEHACARLGHANADIDAIVATINDQIVDEQSPVQVTRIIDLVCAELAVFDKMAAMRYAIQYDFSAPEQFKKYITKLEK